MDFLTEQWFQSTFSPIVETKIFWMVAVPAIFACIMIFAKAFDTTGRYPEA